MLLVAACIGLLVQLSLAKPATPKVTVSVAQNVLSESLQRGRIIFDKDCSQCHSRTRQSCPDLLHKVVNRLGYSYLALFITKQDSLRAAGDPYAVGLQKHFNLASQHNFNYSPKQINDLISFLK